MAGVSAGKRTGSVGEQAAVNYLREQGYVILGRNFKIKFAGGPLRGEIDIIAKKKGVIHFIEVKTAKNESAGSAFPPESRVTAEKRERLIKTAQIWLSSCKIPMNSKWQIDIIAVYGIDSGNEKIRLFENITF